MDSYILCTDLHAQNKPARKLFTHQRLMREISNLGLRTKSNGVICTGDIWHEKFGVNLDVLRMLYDELKWARDRGCPWTVLRGNHEIPVKSQPENSLLTLFQDVCQVILKPHLEVGSNYELYFLPWYLPETFIPYADYLAKKAAASKAQHKILFTHIGLNEAQISPSNYYRVPQRVSIQHLHEKRYTLVFAGDYHMTQVLTPRVMYGGAPIQLAFGDAKDQGVWHLKLGETATVDSIKLTGQYPVYHSLRLERGERLPSFNKHDYYRIQVHLEDLPALDVIAPENVHLEGYGTRIVDQTERRLQDVKSDDPIELFQALLNHKEIQGTDYLRMGTHVIKRAMATMASRGE